MENKNLRLCTLKNEKTGEVLNRWLPIVAVAGSTVFDGNCAPWEVISMGREAEFDYETNQYVGDLTIDEDSRW